jgi:hypothetical protein
MRLILALILTLLSCNAISEEHPYIIFERGFKSMLDDLSWNKFSEKDRVRLTRSIWNGASHDLLIASTIACQGICESHYVLPETYDRYRGYFGMHNKTLLAEVKRRGLGGVSSMWLSYSKRDPIYVSNLSASRLAYLQRCYHGMDEAIKCWVMGEGWNKSSPSYNRKAEIKADRYLSQVKMIRLSYFKR